MKTMNDYEWQAENALRAIEAALSDLYSGDELRRAKLHTEAIRDQVMSGPIRRATEMGTQVGGLPRS